jgi:hypothetical protein
MSRREIVLLVSRAIAILLLISALTELLFGLPQQIYLLLLPILQGQAAYPGVATHMDSVTTLRYINLGFTLTQVAVQFIVAWLFWNCGPTIERFLLPAGSTPEETAEPI